MTEQIQRKSRRTTSPSLEQYVETIAHLLTEDKVCSVSDIAAGAQVSRPAASRAVRDLANMDLVEHKSYGYVDLTDEGHALAERLNARHKAIFEFLHRVLGFEEETADIEACRLEHQLDDEPVGRMAALTAFIEEDEGRRNAWRRFLRESLSRGACMPPPAD